MKRGTRIELDEPGGRGGRMKYMGAKHTMLLNGLGETLIAQASRKARVVDLFSGSGAVTWFAAEQTGLPVMAVDLQEYAAVLARAVVGRTKPVDAAKVAAEWVMPSRRDLLGGQQRDQWLPLERAAKRHLSAHGVRRARSICVSVPGGFIWRAYGGHYYSPRQAHAFDRLLRHVPSDPMTRDLCLAATIIAASRCAAAPGHTAQPFQPTTGALPYISVAWRRCPFDEATLALEDLARRHAMVRGRAVVGDAVAQAKHVKESDLVILDPPYSAVQYSRFYHVLETIALRRETGEVEGAGRYPPASERPQSRFSLKTQSEPAFHELLKSLAASGCSVVLTFPDVSTSNGLSGAAVKELASGYFKVVSAKVAMRFSTLGGNNASRPARSDTHELIVTLSPR